MPSPTLREFLLEPGEPVGCSVRRLIPPVGEQVERQDAMLVCVASTACPPDKVPLQKLQRAFHHFRGVGSHQELRPHLLTDIIPISSRPVAAAPCLEKIVAPDLPVSAAHAPSAPRQNPNVATHPL